MKFLLPPLVVLLGSCSAALAQQTGNSLAADCLGNQVGQLNCQVYFVGFFDGFIVSGGLKQSGICLPSTVTANQVRAVSEQYFREYPQELHMLAANIIKKGLRNAFPCKTP